MHKFIQEWFSPNFHDPMYLPLLLMLLALIAGLAVSPRRPRIRSLVLLLATIPAGLRSMRHIPILVLVIVPVLAELAKAWMTRRGDRRILQRGGNEPTPRTLLVNVVVLITFAVFTAARVSQVVGSQPTTEAKHSPPLQ